jgi:methylmalonyl-CoA mutase cobalamin-binding subunit
MLAGYQDIVGRPRVLLATLPGESHTLPQQMVALYLVVCGAKPRLLGGATPVDEILASAEVLATDVVGITVTLTAERKQARKHIQALRRKLPAHVQLWVGGGGATGLGIHSESTRVVVSWEEIDRAVLDCQNQLQRARADRQV